MKLRLLDNSVRLRLSVAEVDSLATGRTVSALLRFPLGETLRYQIEASAADTAAARFDRETLRVSAPMADLERWGTSDAVTLSYRLDGPSAQISIKIEKDFQCLAPREGEDESLLFPHPRSDTSDCHD